MCAPERGVRKVAQVLRSSVDYEWVPDSKCSPFYTVGLLFGFDLLMAVP